MLNMIPYRRISRMPSLFDDRFLRSFFDLGSPGFRVDVKDQGGQYLLEAELPGLNPEALDVSVDQDVLTITAGNSVETREEKDNYLYCERRSGRVQRRFNLEGIDQERISAKYDNGILRVELPKRCPEATSSERKIPIE